MRLILAALASTVLIGGAKAEIKPEIITVFLTFGAMVYGGTEVDEGFRIEGSTTRSDGSKVPFVMTANTRQPCVVDIEIAESPAHERKPPFEVRTTDWNKVLLDEISVSSAPVHGLAYEAYERTIVIPAQEGFQCVQDEKGQKSCSSRMEIKGAYVPGQRSAHGMHRQALTALMALCHGRKPNLEPEPGTP